MEILRLIVGILQVIAGISVIVAVIYFAYTLHLWKKEK